MKSREFFDRQVEQAVAKVRQQSAHNAASYQRALRQASFWLVVSLVASIIATALRLFYEL